MPTVPEIISAVPEIPAPTDAFTFQVPKPKYIFGWRLEIWQNYPFAYNGNVSFQSYILVYRTGRT